MRPGNAARSAVVATSRSPEPMPGSTACSLPVRCCPAVPPLDCFRASHRLIERSACHGITPLTPSSVAACTASSSRSPLASACASQSSGRGALAADQVDGQASSPPSVDETALDDEPGTVSHGDVLAHANARHRDCMPASSPVTRTTRAGHRHPALDLGISYTTPWVWPMLARRIVPLGELRCRGTCRGAWRRDPAGRSRTRAAPGGGSRRTA